MIRLFDDSSNEGLNTLSQILRRGQHTLGQLQYGQANCESLCPLQGYNLALVYLVVELDYGKMSAPFQRTKLSTGL